MEEIKEGAEQTSGSGKGMLLLLGFLIVVASALLFSYQGNIETEEVELSEVEEYFISSLERGVVERIGQPIEGFEPFMFMEAFLGLVPQDFDGAEALLGSYVFIDKELIFTPDDSKPVHSAAKALSKKGMQSVFANIQQRARVEISSMAEVDGLLIFLGRQDKSASIACLSEQRNADACIALYAPVCATVQIQCITTPCNPIQETFSNSCKACRNSLVTSYTDGACSVSQ